MKDYYKILQIKKEATDLEIKKSYRKLAMLFHPDKNPSISNSEKFIELQEAYLVLGSVENRKLYDKLFHLNISDNNNYRNVYELNLESWQQRAKIISTKYSKMSYSDFSNFLILHLKLWLPIVPRIILLTIFSLSAVLVIIAFFADDSMRLLMLIIFGILIWFSKIQYQAIIEFNKELKR